MRNVWLPWLALSLQFGTPPARCAIDSPVIRLDASLDRLIATDARLQTLHERDTIFEGPTWVREGRHPYLVFSDVPGNVIDKLNPDGSISVLARDIYSRNDLADAYQSTGQKKYWMVGANGTTLDRRGLLVYCAFSDGRIVRIERDGRRTVLASGFAGRRFNALNDLVYASDGSLYFTDSRAATRHKDGEGVPYEGLYVLKAAQVRLLSKDIDHPNGVAFSPDEKQLYVTDTRLKRILLFDLRAGEITNQRVFIDMSADSRPGAPDGVKVDRDGNVYSTGPGGVWIMAPSGRHIGTILTPGTITNLAFGDKDFQTLYLTGMGALYRIPLAARAK